MGRRIRIAAALGGVAGALACGSLDVGTPSGAQFFDASTLANEVGGEDAALTDALVAPGPRPSCVGTALTDDFERGAVGSGSWTSSYSGDPTASLQIEPTDASRILLATTTVSQGPSEAFVQLDVRKTAPTWRLCLALQLEASAPASGRLLAAQILASSPPNSIGSGSYQGLALGVRGRGLILIQSARASCTGGSECRTTETPVSDALNPGPHDVVLDVHASTTDGYGYADVAVDELLVRVPLSVSLANQEERVLRLGIQSNGPSGVLSFDNVRVDLP